MTRNAYGEVTSVDCVAESVAVYGSGLIRDLRGAGHAIGLPSTGGIYLPHPGSRA